MMLFHICTNCKAKIYYTQSKINSQIGYIQSNNVATKGSASIISFNYYDKVKEYFIECPQCEKNTVCGVEVLEEDVNMSEILQNE